jgi:hypothetical protein
MSIFKSMLQAHESQLVVNGRAVDVFEVISSDFGWDF